ncbi:MAG TPA: Rrf2 family transcriptional regulator [Ignavibacteria bacterium]|nr:transcriptional regulator [Bacteroidota bacterium]HRI85988.1 Rrf2 family transcriptional regulator [Ignavibacteria bacterium]HRJ99022.1 Rrf2 family transcriptional regulator [Ignavibacteria bacterium]
MFSKACEYGIKAAIFITYKSKQGGMVSLSEIAAEIDSPVAFTAKVLQQLTKSKIIDSVRGPAGGFHISQNKAEKIKLSKIVKVLDGDSIYNGCGLGLTKCNDKNPCPIHYQFAEIRSGLKQMLETTSLWDLSIGLNNGNAVLKK